MTKEEKSAKFDEIIEKAKKSLSNIDQNLHPMQVFMNQLVIATSMIVEMQALSATPIEQAEPDYKDLLIKYVLHIDAVEGIDFLDWGSEYIGYKEADIIKKLVNEK